MKLSRIELGILFTTTLLSIWATILSYNAQAITLYGDAMAHLLIARRVIDGVTIGLAQLGSYWPPFPHVLALSLVWNDTLFYTGLAGAIFSMLSYVVASLYLYKTAVRLCGKTWPGLIAVAVFALNPSALYMQSTSMTELIMVATMVAAIFHFVVWSQEESINHLALSGGWLYLAGMTRYEGWILTVTLGAMLTYICWRKRYGFVKLQAHLIFWGVLAGLAMVLWPLWSWVIFGDPLDFHRGEYSNPSLWVDPNDPYVGSWPNAILTYYYAITLITGVPLAAVSALGFLVYLIKERLNPRTIATGAMFVFVLFFILMLYGGQRPIYVPAVNQGMYNIRFALVILPPVSLFVAYIFAQLASLIRMQRLVSGVAMVSVVFLTYYNIQVNGIILYDEPRSMKVITPQSEVEWFGANYDYGLVLAENVGNEWLFYLSKVPLGANIYEGTHGWKEALENPMQFKARWIVMRELPKPDKLYKKYLGPDATIEARALLEENYEAVFNDGRVKIFRIKEKLAWKLTSLPKK